MTDLGREIPITDGKKPEWLDGDERCAIKTGKYWHGADGTTRAWEWYWCTESSFFRLRADHPYYKIVPDTHVLVERMTEEQARRELGPDITWKDWCRMKGIIKPDPTPLERFMADHPEADRATAEKVLSWKEAR